jgi:putative dehydrogenase
MEQKRIGVAGLGSMGSGMARSLLRAGYTVQGVDTNAARHAELAERGVVVMGSPAEAASGVTTFLVSVVDAAQTQSVLFGTNGAVETLADGSVVIATSTVPPPYVEALETELRERGILLLDAPVSGGMAKAATGELSIMASGDPKAFTAAAGVLDAIAAKVYRLGDHAGIGSRMKSVNQLLAGVHIAAACEAIAYAIRLGVDPAVAYDVITHSAGNSWMFENRIPHVLENDYTPHSATNIFVKDLGIVLDQGRAEKFPLPLTAAAHQLFLAAAAMGFGGDDDASIARVFAAIADLNLPH